MKKVLVTGASGGIGMAICKYYFNHNYEVIYHYNSSQNKLKELRGVTLVKSDFSNNKSLSKFINQIAEIGPIDVLINNAADTKYKSNIDEYSYEGVLKILSVNTIAPFLLCKEAIKGMKSKRWGRIVNISSIGVKYGGSYNSMDYTFSKSALESITTSLAKQYTSDNILINCIRVGVTNTKFHEKNPKDMSKRISLIPIGRMAKPDEIAKVVYFLGSDENSYISGDTITVAGGE